MSGYGQFCAVARAHEALGGRWTLLIVRELLSGAYPDSNEDPPWHPAHLPNDAVGTSCRR